MRSSGERTRDECIRRAALIGEVELIEGVAPFSAVLRETYEIGATFEGQEWVPVIDGDVLLEEGAILRGIEELRGRRDIFCLDGKTKDKILAKKRRAGIHIYRRELLEAALDYVGESLKPETRAREAMALRHRKATFIGEVIYGRHDHEQYYRDLWRKAFIQTQKLRKTLKRRDYIGKWRQLATAGDDDYRVILAAHRAGNREEGTLRFDATENYGALEGLRRLGIEEKRPL